MRKKNIGQSTLEYAVIIAVVVGALLAIQIYLKRGVQGKLRESTDQIGQQFEANMTTGGSATRTVYDSTTVQAVNKGQTTVTSNAATGETTDETVEGWK